MSDEPTNQAPNDYARFVQGFREALLSTKPADVIRRHITTGDPVGIDPDTYFALRKSVADRFQLHPSGVVVVGSCRLGFTLKKVSGARYRLLLHDSDVDVAIVSNRMFESYWDKVFDLAQYDRNWSANGGKKFAKDLFCGWITPQTLPNLPRFEEAREWAEFFDGLTQRRTCGLREVKARLYRSWDRLEAYQLINVLSCRRELENQK